MCDIMLVFFRDIFHNVQSSAVITRSDFYLTIDTPYLVLKGELWRVFCEDSGEK